MKNITCLFLFCLLFITGITSAQKKTNYNWKAIADSAQMGLEIYWSSEDQYYLKNNNHDTAFHYWWMAHAIDVLVDGYERTTDEKYITQIGELYAGVNAKNRRTFLNVYYDDMEWMALALLRVYNCTKNEVYKKTLDLLWKDIKGGWNEKMGGGIAWRKDQREYKNIPANAPACILAARMYKQFGNTSDLNWAKKIHKWMKAKLVDPQTGLVWDGINREKNGAIDKNWQFTYCQGVYIGASIELYNITKDKNYFDDALRTAKYVINDNNKLSPNGILNAEGQGDGGLFKGIFVRYLEQLIYKITDRKERQIYVDFLITNAESLWAKGTKRPEVIFNNDWTKLPEGYIDASTELSGVMFMESMYRLYQRVIK